MFLYDNKNDYIDIYEFKPNRGKIIDYKLKEIKKIPEEERVFIAEAKTGIYGERPLFEKYTRSMHKDDEIDGKIVNEEEKKFAIPYEKYHLLKHDHDKKNIKFLENCYVYSDLKDKNAIRINYLEKIKYYLLYSKKYKYLGEYEGGKNFRMDNIMQLTEPLYLLHLIEQERFASIEDKDIEEQLSLFTLNKLNVVSKSQFEDPTKPILEERYKRITSKAKNDSHILKLIKK